MKGKVLILMGLNFISLFSQVPPKLFIAPEVDQFELGINVSIRDSVDTLQGKTFFIYEYILINSSTSQQPIFEFEIPRRSRPGFSISDVYYYKGDTVFSKYVPCKIPNPTKAVWIKLDSSLTPGDTVSGLILVSRDLPDISYWYAEGIDTFYFPIMFGEEAEDSLDKYYYSKTPFGPGKYGRTVGPGPLPPGFYGADSVYYVEGEGLYHIKDRIQGCYEEGWLTDRAKRRLDNMISRAIRHYENWRISQCLRTLEQIMDYLLRERGLQVKEEAFYVLYYRTKFVEEHFLFQPERKK